jgi:aryl-alcohol dehydrogenase-like predicted oxidoreductase
MSYTSIQLQLLLERNGWTNSTSVRIYCHLRYREEEPEMIRFCKETGVGIMPWSPLFAGILARPPGLTTRSDPKGSRYISHV